MSETYFDIIPTDILDLILLEVDDPIDLAHLSESGISSVESHLRKEKFWKSKIKVLFPNGDDKYINPYLTTFKDDDYNLTIVIMKYTILSNISVTIRYIIDEMLDEINFYETNNLYRSHYIIGKSDLKFINNYDCLKLNSLPHYEEKEIVRMAMYPRSYRDPRIELIIIPQTPRIYKFKISNVEHEITFEDIMNIIGHIISNGYSVI